MLNGNKKRSMSFGQQQQFCGLDPWGSMRHCQGKLWHISFETVKVAENSRNVIKLKLKAIKESRVGAGTILEIFANDTFLCPKMALNRYHQSKIGLGNMEDDMPFFQKTDGSCYSGKDFNKKLAELTHGVTDGTNGVVRSHTFRSGIPSELCKLGATAEQNLWHW